MSSEPNEIERLRTELDLHRANTREAIVEEVMTATERVSAARAGFSADFYDEVRCTAGQLGDPTGVCTRHAAHYWCIHCEGFYGVPHNGRCHTAAVRGDAHIVGVGSPSPKQCACRYCRTWASDGYEAAEAKFRGTAKNRGRGNQ